MKALAAHLFLPDQTNNQRARVLHPQALIVYIVVFFILQMGFRIGKFVYPDILGIATNITVDDLLSLTNQKRQENGLSPLSLESTLSEAAFNKAQDMFSKSYWSHFAPDGKTPWQFIEDSGYVYLFAGENLAKDFADSQGVVSAWMASPSHRDNILKKEYEDVGLAAVNGKLNGEETTLVVQMFGKRRATLALKMPLVPAEAAVAETSLSISSTPLPTLTPVPSITPTTPVLVKISPIVASSHLQSRKQPEEVYLAATVIKSPLIDIVDLERKFSLALIMLLLSVLAVDSVFVLKRKTIRVVGHNVAHIIFLVTLIGLVFLTKKGAIL